MDPLLKYILSALSGAAVIVFIAAVGYAFNRLSKSRDNKSAEVLQDERDAIKEVAVQKELVAALTLKMAVLEAEAKPINAAYLAMLVAKATHFHTPVMDALIIKLGPPSHLTAEERTELEAAIQQRMTDMGPEISESERIGVRIMMDVSRLADIEAKEMSAAQMETVLVAQPVAEKIQEEV